MGRDRYDAAKLPTFGSARAAILRDLAALDWAVRTDLKIPHATRPDGRVRFWFKPQAVHFTVTDGQYGRHDLGDARAISYDFDVRRATVTDFVETARRIAP